MKVSRFLSRSLLMRTLPLPLVLLATLTLVGCGKGPVAAAAPGLQPIDSVLLQAPQASSEPAIQLEQQTRQEQSARHGENSRTGLPRPQRHGLRLTP
jgi:hypothetical protein